MGVLQLAVPSYGLRLARQFGCRQVGWALVVAFLGLALLNLTGGLVPAGHRLEWGLARGIVGMAVPLLLLIGMAHVETLFRDRARVEREQSLKIAELERLLAWRTEELSEAKEEFSRELSRREQAQRASSEWARRQRLGLGMQVAAAAGQVLNRHVAVIDLYAKLLLLQPAGLADARSRERLLAGAAEARALGRRLLAAGGLQPLRTQLLSLSDVVRRHAPTLRGLLGGHRLLDCSCPADAPLVWADPQIVRWMLEELFRNAREVTASTGRVRITVGRVNLNQPHPGPDSRVTQFVCVAVTDTGPGMDREVQTHLGEPFFTTNPGQRSGLGLASVSGLVKAHGGWLAVTSAPGHGTTVRLFFPSAAEYPSGTWPAVSSRADRWDLRPPGALKA